MKAVTSHTQGCAKFIELFRTAPSAALDPETEYRRFAAHARSDEGRAEATGSMLDRYGVFKAEGERRVELAQARWRGTRPAAAAVCAMPADGSVFGVGLEGFTILLDSSDARAVVAARAALGV